jgi:hypothetical protein
MLPVYVGRDEVKFRKVEDKNHNDKGDEKSLEGRITD